MSRSSAFNLPNILTYARIAAVGAVTVCFLVPGETSRWVAVAIFIAAAITDFLDGYLARMWAQQSALGRMLDPIADKLLVAACLLLMAADGTITGRRSWLRS